MIWVHEVAGSNPVLPTKNLNLKEFIMKKITVCDTENNNVTDQIDYNVPLTDYDIICEVIAANNDCNKDCQNCIIQKLYSTNQE